MTSIDELFKKPNLPSKRKIEPLTDPNRVYKSAKITPNSDAKQPGFASVEDDGAEEEGPELPPGGVEDDYGPDDEEGRFFGGGMGKGTEDAMDYLDQQDQEATFVQEKFDSSWVKKTALNLERRIGKNAELRSKHEEEPQKFMGSEADLDADIKALSILSEHPELYGESAKFGIAGRLVSLLTHENTDIAIGAIEIINELTDEDVNAEQDQWNALVDAMLEADILDLLIQTFDRLDETIESDRSGIYHSLSVLENLASRPSISETIGRDAKLISWLIARIQIREPNLGQNKQYSAEILAILLQSSVSNRQRFIDLDGVETLLTILSAYRKKDPAKDSEEEEYVENLFDSLTCVVDEPEGKAKFVEAEGVELCLIMLKEGKMSKSRALTVLDHAVAEKMGGSAVGFSANGSSEDRKTLLGADVCSKLVEAEGLRRAFGMFMKKNDGSTNEHLLGIFSALLRSLPGGSAARIRTLAKFVEKDYEKIGKIVLLRREYVVRVNTANQQIEQEQSGLDKQELVELEDEWLSRRLEAGLSCLQTIDTILAWLVAEDDGAKRKIVELLAERDESLSDIRRTLENQLESIGEGDETDEHALRDVLNTLVPFLQ